MKPFTRTAAGVFAAVAFIHLSRLIFHFQIMVMGYEVPLWINVLGVAIASVLSWGLWKESRIS